MNGYMLRQNLRARGVSEEEISNVIKFRGMITTVETKHGTVVDVECKPGGWFYLV